MDKDTVSFSDEKPRIAGYYFYGTKDRRSFSLVHVFKYEGEFHQGYVINGNSPYNMVFAHGLVDDEDGQWSNILVPKAKDKDMYV